MQQQQQSGLGGMGGMGSLRPPGKSGLTFDHIISRLQGELQKSRETGLLLLLHAWSAGTAVRVSGSAKVETTTRERAHRARRIWARSRCRIGVAEDTNHTSSHLVVDDGLVVFANDVDTEFL
jgi:hypothetical protein